MLKLFKTFCVPRAYLVRTLCTPCASWTLCVPYAYLGAQTIDATYPDTIDEDCYALHDGIGQQLVMLKQKAQNLNQTALIELAQNTLDEVRNISRDLYPATLIKLGLK